MIHILTGPQAIGKTRLSSHLATALQVSYIVDDWNGSDELRDGALAITNSQDFKSHGYTVYSVESEEDILKLIAAGGAKNTAGITRKNVFIGCTGEADFMPQHAGKRFWPVDTRQVEECAPFEDALANWVRTQTEPFIMADAAFDGLGLPVEKITPALVTKLGIILKRLGCTRQKRDGLNLYCPPSNQVSASHPSEPSATLLQEIAELHLLTRPGARFAPPESASFLRSGPASRSDQSGEIKPAPLAASPEAAAPNPSVQQSDQSSAQNSAQSPLPETPFPQEPVHCSLP